MNKEQLLIKDQILSLRRLMHCMMTPQSTLDKQNPYNVKPLSARQILHRAEAAESMLTLLKQDVNCAGADPNYHNYVRELNEIQELMVKAQKVSRLEAQSTTTPHPIKTNHLKAIHGCDPKVNAESNSYAIFSLEDDGDDHDDDFEYIESDEGILDDETSNEQDVPPEPSSKPTGSNNANTKVRMNNFDQQTPEEIKKEQSEALQSELRLMASQLKQTTSSLHTNLKTQNATLLTQLEQQASDNLNKVGTVASDTADRAKKRKWGRAAAKWGILISCMVTFCFIFMIMRIFPKRKNACLFFGCSKSPRSEKKKTFKRHTSYSNTRENDHSHHEGSRQNTQYSRGSQKTSNDGKNTSYHGKKKQSFERKKEVTSVICKEADPISGQCVHFLLPSDKNPDVWQLEQDSKERRKLLSLNKASSISIQKQELYATWWDHTEDALKKRKQEQEEKINKEMEETRRLYEWRMEQKEKARKYKEEQEKKQIEREIEFEGSNEKPSDTYLKDHMEKKREHDRTKMHQRQHNEAMEVEVGIDASTEKLNKLVNLETNEIEEPGCIAAARAEKQRLEGNQGIVDNGEAINVNQEKDNDSSEAEWMKELKRAEDEKRQQDGGAIDSNRDENINTNTEDNIDEKEEIDLFQEEINFMSYAARGNAYEASFLLQKYPQLVNYMDGNGWYPLHEAARYGHVDMIRLIIGVGGDINVRTNYGKGGTALWWALKAKGRDDPSVTFLRENGAVEIAPL